MSAGGLPEWARGKNVPVPDKCTKCETVFHRSSQRPTLCPKCRKQRRAEREMIRRHRDKVITEIAERAGRTPDEIAVSKKKAKATGHSWVPDRQPSGTYTNAGSDDGISTFDKDLATQLTQMHGAAVMHKWWYECPNWVRFD